MKTALSRRSSQHKYRRFYAVAVWAALFLQLHLFFAADLHHHALRWLAREAAQDTRPGTTSIAALPAPVPFCPVCQIALNGAVQAQVANPVPTLARQEQRIAFAPALGFLARFPMLDRGRSPPLS
jgi:hypothetical protein